MTDQPQLFRGFLLRFFGFRQQRRLDDARYFSSLAQGILRQHCRSFPLDSHNPILIAQSGLEQKRIHLLVIQELNQQYQLPLLYPYNCTALPSRIFSRPPLATNPGVMERGNVARGGSERKRLFHNITSNLHRFTVLIILFPIYNCDCLLLLPPLPLASFYYLLYY